MIMRELLWILRYAIRSMQWQIVLWYKDILAWRRFWKSYRRYQEIAPADRQPSLENLYPCLGDDIKETPIEPIYFYQDAWAFEKIFKNSPSIHVDIGSHHKFVALLSKVVRVIMIDIRPLSLPMDTLEFREGSILNIPFKDATLPSVSCLCVVEHIGLGRYGDPLDPWGTEKAIEELKRVIAPGGSLYISLPINDQNCTYFNAHRAFNEEYVMKLFYPLIVEEKRYIFGNKFTDTHETGFGIGCYHLRNGVR